MDGGGLILSNNSSTEYKENFALRLSRWTFAFLLFPALVSFILNIIALIWNINLGNILPINYFNKEGSFTVRSFNFNSYLEFMKLFIFFWLKLLSTSQALFIGLVSLDIVRYQSIKKVGFLKKQINKINRYNEIEKNIRSLIGRFLFRILKNLVVFRTVWIEVIFLYTIILFSGIYK
jgi:hypothetical protein